MKSLQPGQKPKRTNSSSARIDPIEGQPIPALVPGHYVIDSVPSNKMAWSAPQAIYVLLGEKISVKSSDANTRILCELERSPNPTRNPSCAPPRLSLRYFNDTHDRFEVSIPNDGK